MTQFSDLGLATPLLEALAAESYTLPTPIQAQAIPHVLAGRDLLGIAQTGTGKTAAFALPILHRLAAERRPPLPHCCRVLVLAPTRELASQIEDSFQTYGRNLRLTSTVVFGGVDMRRQQRIMARGVDILVATPGRLVDHLGQRSIRLDRVEVVVLDEVDRMLDIGFIHAIRRVMSHVPKQRQSLFFSATLPKDIAALAAELLKDPATVKVIPAATTAERVEQRVVHVDQAAKKAVLAKLMAEPAVTRAIVFTRTKHRADQVTRHLLGAGVEAAAIHGNKSQNNRERALAGFKDGSTKVLVATDIAARGIDVDGVSHVVNFDLPDVRRDLRPPHRPHRPRRRPGPGDRLLLGRRERQLARHRGADPPARAGHAGRGQPLDRGGCGGRAQRGAAPLHPARRPPVRVARSRRAGLHPSATAPHGRGMAMPSPRRRAAGSRPVRAGGGRMQ